MDAYIYPGLNKVNKLEYLHELNKSIISIVCVACKVRLSDVKSSMRKREVVETRMLCAYFCRKYTKLTLKGIGALLGGRDHTTAIYNIKRCLELTVVDKNFKVLFDKIQKEIVEVE